MGIFFSFPNPHFLTYVMSLSGIKFKFKGKHARLISYGQVL